MAFSTDAGGSLRRTPSGGFGGGDPAPGRRAAGGGRLFPPARHHEVVAGILQGICRAAPPASPGDPRRPDGYRFRISSHPGGEGGRMTGAKQTLSGGGNGASADRSEDVRLETLEDFAR